MSGRKQQDEMLYCERCGISFLWTVEEQKRQTITTETVVPAKDAPRLCPGCCHLLPSATRERGLVKWFNPRKNYGFIIRRNGAELYVHGAVLSEATPLAPDDLVEFQIGANERGPAAQAVTRLG
jgi:CspA family cold shock protein